MQTAISIGFRVSFVIDQFPGSMDPCPCCGDPMIGGMVAVRGDLWLESSKTWRQCWVDPQPMSCLPCAGDKYLMELPKYVA